MPIQRLFALVILLLPLVGCVEDYNYVVADRHYVDLSELPALHELDWREQEVDSFVSSRAHARLIPEADWTGPIESMRHGRVEKTDGEGNVLGRSEFPVGDGCIYVGMSRFKRFWRLQHGSRTLFFAVYMASASVRAESGGQYYRLAVIDEDHGMRRYELALENPRIRILQSERRLAVLVERQSQLLLHEIDLQGRDLILRSPSVVVDSGGDVERWNAEMARDGTIHVAWMEENDSFGRSWSAFYARLDGQVVDEGSALLLTRSATGKTIKILQSSGRVFVAWFDARFRRAIVGIQNSSKLFVAEINGHAESLGQPVVLNTPADTSDIASEPFFILSRDSRLLVLWSPTSEGAVVPSELRYGSLDYDSRSLALARGAVNGDELFQIAVNQERRVQRANPVGQYSMPADQECDCWRERGIAKRWREGFGLSVMPHGLPKPEDAPEKCREILEALDL